MPSFNDINLKKWKEKNNVGRKKFKAVCSKDNNKKE